MDLYKIGKFIADCRKNNNLTQTQLAEKLHVTDRAVSKWECGKSMPDSSIMLELCSILNISVNELLTGEKISMEDYNKQAENNLIEMKKQKELADKRLLNLEIVLGSLGVIFLLSMCLITAYTEIALWLKVVLLVLGFVVCFVVCFICIKIEQVAGYYECAHCHHRYIPTYKQINFSMHMGRTRYLKCPKCGKKSWNKKVIGEKE